MLVPLSLLSRRLQTAAIFFQAFLVVAQASNLHALWQKPRPCTCQGCILSARSVTVYGHVSKSERGKLLAPIHSCSFQPRLPKPQIPSQSVFSARMHGLTPHKASGLITKGREKPELATDWASWVNVNGNHRGIFYTLRGMQHRLGVCGTRGGLGLNRQSFTWVYEYIQAMTCPFIP